MTLVVVAEIAGGGVAIAMVITFDSMMSQSVSTYLSRCGGVSIYLFIYFSLTLATLRLSRGLQNEIHNRALSITLGPHWCLSQNSS
jgi:hypothetical protein